MNHQRVRTSWSLAVSACVIAAGLASPAPAGAASESDSSRDGARAARVVTANLSGEAEVPGPGDNNGRGRVVVKLYRAKAKVCVQVEYKRIGDPNAAHIHEGGAKVSGDVVIDLSGSVTGGSTCAKGVSRALIRDIADRPRHYYFNIHNTKYPGGAIRGQLRG